MPSLPTDNQWITGNDAYSSKAPVKQDENKPAMELIPPRALLLVGEAMAYGAKKYGVNNYLLGEGLNPRRLIGACFRHCLQFLGGNRFDEESGVHHLAHAASNLLMALEVILTKEKKE